MHHGTANDAPQEIAGSGCTRETRLITDADEVVGELLHDSVRLAPLCGRDVLRDEHGLLRLHDRAPIGLYHRSILVPSPYSGIDDGD